MFERMKVAKYIYEGVVELSYKRPTREDANRSDHNRENRGESASSWTRPKKSESDGKLRKRHVDNLTVKSKKCLIHGPIYYSEECKVLGDFGTIYAKSRPTQAHQNIPVPRKKLTGSKKTTS